MMRVATFLKAVVALAFLTTAYAACRPGFTGVGNVCYSIPDMTGTWIDALSMCMAQGAYLGDIESAAEQQLGGFSTRERIRGDYVSLCVMEVACKRLCIAEIFQIAQLTGLMLTRYWADAFGIGTVSADGHWCWTHIWLGARKHVPVKDQWRLIRNGMEMTYFDWLTGTPDGDGMCLDIYRDHFNDAPCDHISHFVCKYYDATSGFWTPWNTARVRDFNSGQWLMRRATKPIPCGSATPAYIRVQQQVGNSWELLLQAGDLIVVGPRYGLSCWNENNPLDPPWWECSNYRVRYHTCSNASAWLNRDFPSGYCDCEQASAESPANQDWASNSHFIEYQALSPSVVKTYGVKLDRKVHVGADFGFFCSHYENMLLGLGKCKTYRVQYYCPSLTSPTL